LKKALSALSPKADMCSATRDVRFGPIADMPPYSRTSTGLLTSRSKTFRKSCGSFATLAAIRRASTVLLLWHCVVEFSVVEQQTTLRRNAGDVLVAMMPADVARGIGVTRMEQLGRGVIKAADIEH
jgi:hypothetical protein